MKLSLFERAITCCLLGAGTIAVASGMKMTSHRTEGTGASMVRPDGDDDAESPDGAQDAEEGTESDDDEAEGAIEKLIVEAQEATDEAKEEKRNALKDALTEVFRKRTESQRTRIAGMKAKLEAIEAQLDRRTNLEDQIVQRRLGELLGDKDELSWDHEPAIDFDGLGKSDGAKHFLDRAFGFEFPTEFPLELESVMTMANDKYRQTDPRSREQLLQARKQAEQAKMQAERVATEFATVQKKRMEQARFTNENNSELRAIRSDLDCKLPDWIGLQKSIEGKQRLLEQIRGKEGEMEALRGKLNKLDVMRGQSDALQQQIEAASQGNANTARRMEEWAKRNDEAAQRRGK